MPEVPAILKHMTLAIFRKGGNLKAPTKERFRQAYQIALSQCQKNGLIAGMKPTAKGMKHESEGMRGFIKDKSFDAMFAWIMSESEKKETKTAIKTGEIKSGDQQQSNKLHIYGRNQKR